MNKEKYIEHQHLDDQEARLHYECEQALLRLEFEAPNINDEWQKFTQQEDKPATTRTKRSGKVRLWLLGAVSAAAVALLGVFLLQDKSLKEGEHISVTVAENIETAVMIEEVTSADGDTRKVLYTKNNHEQVNRGAVMSSEKADFTQADEEDIQLQVISIPRGQVYHVKLSDGTEVWMNADSKLTFPSRFIGEERVVKLEGEAYFKVAHNKEMPFIIQSNRVLTKVLGTEFNIRAFKGSPTHVTLINGSVAVEMPEIKKEIFLTPGKSLAYAEKKFQVKEVDTSHCAMWKEGFFYFDDMSLIEILKDLGHWYNVSIEMEPDTALMNLRLHFVADRSENIDQVIENLNAFSYLNVYKKQETLIIKRKK